MLFGQLDENTTKLHTAQDGNIWYANGANPAVNSGLVLKPFLLTSHVTGVSKAFRLLGTARNAELIMSLVSRKNTGEIRSVELAGPNALDALDAQHDPQLAIMGMRACVAPVACGGWHEVSKADYPVYAMLVRARKDGADAYSETQTRLIVQGYLRLCPFYKALTLIPTLERGALASLTATIIDPRWFVDKRMPDRGAKLELYLGLTPKTQCRLLDPDTRDATLHTSRGLRCATVMTVWKTLRPDEVDATLPENFLYRILATHGNNWRGNLRASQAFIRYLRAHWLAGLDSRVGVQDGLFAPELFFKSPAEVATYHQHMSTVA